MKTYFYRFDRTFQILANAKADNYNDLWSVDLEMN
jgi:hypothetical protein